VGSFLQGTPKLSTISEWKTAGQDTDVRLSGHGIYAVEAEVSDQVGNTSLTRSQAVAIDASVPDIRITGVENGSANASAVRIKVSCTDPSYLPGSLKAEMKADFGGRIPDFALSEDSPDEATLSFEDFPRQKEADAVYHLSVTASDRAGNHAGKQISFFYTDYDGRKKQILRNEGRPYIVSPYTMIWNGDYYYLVGWNHEQEETRTYRVDRILQTPDILKEDARPVPEDFDVARYTREVFRMYDNQEPEDVTLLCANEVMKGVLDQFGMDIRVKKADKDHFRTRVKVCISPTFYSWVFQWGGAVRIEGAEGAAEEYREMARKALEE
jgi:hypothetical protein